MAKKNSLLLYVFVSNDDESRGFEVGLQPCEPGYYLETIKIGGTNFHIEAIEVKETVLKYGVRIESINEDYQNRIDRYVEANEGSFPNRVKIGRKKHIVCIEAFA